MDERSKRAQMERKRRIRRKKQRRRVLISALVEVLILAVLAFAFCWNRGLGTKISGFFGRFRQTACEGTGCDGSKQF